MIANGRNSKRAWVIAAAIATTAVVVGCSSNSKSTSSSSSGTSGSGSSQSSGSKLTGSPIPVLVEGTWSGVSGAALPQVRDSVLAGIKDINAHGGINGHPVNPVVCDDQGDANRATQCLEQALQQHVVAWLWPSATTNLGVMPLMVSAGLVGIGGTADDQAGQTSPASYPISGAIPGIFAGMPESLVAAGAKNISFIYPSNLGSASASLLHFFNEGIATSKAHIAHIVGVPIATTDFGPAVATALQGADGVAAYMPVVSQAILVKTLRASNPNIQIALGSFQLGSSAVKELGSPAGLHIVGFGAQPTADVPAAKQFMTDMAKYFPSAPGLDDQSLGAWESTQVFAKIARSMPDVTAAAITGAMKSLTNFGLGGYAPPLTTTAGSCNVCGGATRILNPNVAFLKAEPDGSLVFAASNQFYNAFTGQTYTYSPS